MLEWIVLIAAGYLAGVLNAIAGGGSFLTFPVLVWTGVPPITANATSAVAVLPGYLGGAAGFKRELSEMSRRQHVQMSVVGLAGGLCGGLLLLVTPAELFSQVVPLLLLLATLMFAFGQRLMGLIRKSDHPLPLLPGLFVVAVYGGYFNGGLGIMLLAMFAAAGMTSMLLMNGLKNWISFVISLISVVAFAIAGKVLWVEAVVMMLAATLGGYQGAALSRLLPTLWVKAFVVFVGLVMTAIFFIRA
ncbi:sulfite exporter TauE/SafE family protein [Marinobacterium marinum]|uniref:Probable membrane transporter protein n=1 Tax=Marinobacterium marinum TaxID=2756129 RepID=A0A7W2AC80_9GAMM|nr:sulfite exporter TauE/SafE family protein [Marinobacterium marinum]MBA4502199.1 sulfite exporter TauE/SafE family protein [Marinobacterium marinum]